MLKFTAWFLAICLFFLSFGFVFAENLGSIFLNPKSVKHLLNQVNFYDQSKSIIKNNVLSTEDLDSQEVIDLSNALNLTIENYDFQAQAETTIDNFFADLKNKSGSVYLFYDLRTFKSELMKNVPQSADIPKDDIMRSLPDEWRIDLKNFSPLFPTISFFYRNNLYILISYFFLWLVLFLVCIAISKKYLNLFFFTLLFTALPILGQYVLFLLLKPDEVINFLTAGLSREFLGETLSQGGSGLELLVRSIMSYIRIEFLSLLLWESIIPIVIAIFGIITIKVIKIDNKKIPLND